jgi:two-component system, cell cycle sensor histidine kinase and response regulator CckA
MSAGVPTVPAPPSSFLAREMRPMIVGVAILAVILWLFGQTLLATNFLPHSYCLVGNARLLWTNVIADLLIGLSYVLISVTLVWVVRRTRGDLPYSEFFWAFGLFIVSCGVTHFLEVVTIWKPVYWLSAFAKGVTALASVGTAAVLLACADKIVALVRTARESAARRGNERFRTLIEASPVGVVAFDRDTRILTWNSAAVRIFGWEEAEVIGAVSPLTPADRQAEHQALLKKTFAGEISTGIETTCITRDARILPVAVSIAPVYDEAGTLTGGMVMFEDITERKRIESELKRLEGEVRQAQKMEVLGRLAGGVAHDFNNMLMVLGGCSELLERALPGESPARIYLDQIQRTTEKATAITKQLLTFSRKQVVELRAIDLHKALTESEFMLPRLLGSDIELTFCHEATQSWILSDPSQLEQVVANLAINARDAMTSGGRLTISTRNADSLPDDAAANSGQGAARWVILEVADTGTGIDEKTRAHIFEPFFTTKPGSKGTGLGLATVYSIVKQNNGHIHVDSVLGLGTRFQLYFLATDPAPSLSSVVKPAEIEVESGGDATILVVDDEAALREAVVQVLRSSGYRVLEAQSAPDALDIAQRHSGHVDILLTDIVMPHLRGTELARRIVNVHPEIQVIYMSGYADGFHESEVLENAIFLQKPFRFATLLEQLKLVRRRH